MVIFHSYVSLPEGIDDFSIQKIPPSSMVKLPEGNSKLLIHLRPGYHLQLLRRHVAQRHSHRAADHGASGAGGSAAETQRKGLLGDGWEISQKTGGNPWKSHRNGSFNIGKPSCK